MEPPVVDDDAPAEPTDFVAIGETYSQVVARLGPPTLNPEENPGEPDWIEWEVSLEGHRVQLIVIFEARRVASFEFSPIETGK